MSAMAVRLPQVAGAADTPRSPGSFPRLGAGARRALAHLDLQRTALGSMGFEPQGCVRLFRATQLQKATVQQQLVPLCGRSDSTYAVIRPEAYGREPQETHDSPLSEAEAPSSKTAPSKTHKKNIPECQHSLSFCRSCPRPPDIRTAKRSTLAVVSTTCRSICIGHCCEVVYILKSH